MARAPRAPRARRPSRARRGGFSLALAALAAAVTAAVPPPGEAEAEAAAAALAASAEACNADEVGDGCALSLRQLRGERLEAQLGLDTAAEDGQTAGSFCCYTSGDAHDICGSCYPNAVAAVGTWCATESACGGCGGNWCTSRSATSGGPVDTSNLMKGISYGASPLLTRGTLPHDDFWCDDAKAQWGNGGRGDLQVIRALGANSVRLYGNNAELDHRDFLDTAHGLGLSVVPGVSDWPYAQSHDNCQQNSDYDCYRQVKEAYAKNLAKGFLVKDNTFHPAIGYVIAINEPDMKLPDVSHPGLAQMWVLRDAFHNPSKYNYTARNDLSELYRTRFTNSFNTANPSIEIPKLFLDDYELEFPETPVFIAEYHNPNNADRETDVENILRISARSPTLLGISFFEYMIRFDEGGHLDFGIFTPKKVRPRLGAARGSQHPLRITLGGTQYDVPCLVPVEDSKTNNTVPAMLAAAFGGPYLDVSLLCAPDPGKVPLTRMGYEQILGSRNTTRMATFVANLVGHLGGTVAPASPGLANFAIRFLPPNVQNPDTSWSMMNGQLAQRPTFASWSASPTCLADRNAAKASVGQAIDYVCGADPGVFNCDSITAECKASVWDTANFVFGSHFEGLRRSTGKAPDPLQACYFDGAAILSAAPAPPGSLQGCVVGPR